MAKLTKPQASLLLENVLDTLVEVGNGVTDRDLHEAADMLFRFRDEWFKKGTRWGCHVCGDVHDVVRNQVRICPGTINYIPCLTTKELSAETRAMCMHCGQAHKDKRARMPDGSNRFATGYCVLSNAP